MVSAAIALAGGAGAGGWVIGRSASGDDPMLERRVSALSSSLRRTAAERDRLRGERDRLEQQLAATGSPLPCPGEFLRSGDAGLLAPFSVDYPCGWSVLEEPLQTPGDPSRKGLQVDNLFFNAAPISKAPREGPLTQIEIDAWYDDRNQEGDALPSAADWIAELKSRFGRVRQTTVRTEAGIAVVRLAGTMVLLDEPVEATFYVWEFTDAQALRRIVEAYAFSPSPSIEAVLDRMVRSFRAKGA